MLPTNYGNGTGMAITPLLNRHVSTPCRLPEPVRSSSYCHSIFLQLYILFRRPPNPFKRFLYTNICVRKILYFVNRASCCKFLLITNLTPFFYVFIYFISLHVSSITVLIIRRSNCINTSSDMISLCK
jgi:hypothetical protein